MQQQFSFGGAATICTSEFPFSRCINYYAVNDPILNVVPAAVKALRSGFSFGSGMEQEIIFLASRTGKQFVASGKVRNNVLISGHVSKLSQVILSQTTAC